MSRFRPLPLALVIAVAVVALQALLVPLFAGPAAHLVPRDLPIAIAGPPPATAALKARLEAAHPGAFAITQVPDAASVNEGIRDRSVYGAIVLTPAGVTVHVSSAGSPAVAALLTQIATGLGAPVQDVIPAGPRGAGLAVAFLPLALTALLAGVLLFLLVHRRAARIFGLLAFAVLAGLTGAAALQLPGDYGSVAAAIALISLAVAAPVTGLGALCGRPGVVAGVAVLFLVGNALSAVAAAPELLPQPWGRVGQDLPIGAGATLLRSVVWFGGSGATPEAAVLIAYVLGGLILVAAGRRGLSRRGGEIALPVREAVRRTPDPQPRPA
jgi:hypothetical protein